MSEIISIFECKTKIVNNREIALTRREFEQTCKGHNIIHVRNATATPRANGQCERLNRTILTMLATTCRGETDWKDTVKYK